MPPPPVYLVVRLDPGQPSIRSRHDTDEAALAAFGALLRIDRPYLVVRLDEADAWTPQPVTVLRADGIDEATAQRDPSLQRAIRLAWLDVK